VIVVTGLSAGLGLWRVDARSLWYDEGITWQVAIQKVGEVISISKPRYGHMLIYWLLEHFLVSWFGSSPFVMRAPSVIGGAAAVPIMYLLVRRLARSRLAGVYAAILYAVSMPLVFWQQDVKVYALMVPFCVASTFALVVAVQDRSWKAAVAWPLLTLLACYLNPQALLLIPAQAVVLVAWPQARARWRSLGPGLAVMSGVVVPAVIDAVHFATSFSYLVPAPSASRVQGMSAFLASAEWEVQPLNAEQRALVYVTAAVWLVALVALVMDLARWGRTRANFPLALALSWMAVPPLIAYAISSLGPHDVFVDRYMMDSLPAAAAVVAVALARVEPRAVGVFGLIYMTVFRFGVLAPSYGKPLNDFATATSIVLDNARPGDCVTFDVQSGYVLFDYYVLRDTAAESDPVLPAEAFPYIPQPWHVPPPTVTAIGDYYEAGVAVLQANPAYVAKTALLCPRLWLLVVNAVGGDNLSTGALGLVYPSLATAYREDRSWFPAGLELRLYSRRA
jgi:4-amino-4-deoxy-L-arabinose transferase-like glycosyltransferase